LLLAGAGAAATAAIPDIALAAKKKALSKSHLDRAAWEPLVGEPLFVRNRGYAPIPVTLLRVGDFPSSNKKKSYRERTFYLVFRGPADAPLALDTHLIKVPGIGKVKVWFSHAYQVEGAWEYVAVFANAKARQRPPKKPRTKGSKKQRRRSGKKKDAERKKDARKAERRREAPAEKPAAPAEPAPAPAEKPAAPAEPTLVP
jgi:hypothetical protein